MINRISSQSFEAYKRQQYSKIYHHELAHKTAGGNLAGPIVIEEDKDGVPVAGHVDIELPRVNKNNPNETIDRANTVIDAALAPSDPSSQDLKVAKKAEDIKAEAERVKANNECKDGTCGNMLNYWA